MTIAKTQAIFLPCDKTSFSCSQCKQGKLFYVLFVSLFLFPNLVTPLNIGTRIITTSEVIVLLVVLALIPSLKMRLGDLLILIGVLIIGLVSVLISISPTESFNSLLSLVFYSFFTFVMIQTARGKPLFIDLFIDAFLTAVLILSVYAIFQSIYVNLFGPLDRIIYPFGVFTWHTQSQLLISWRANSLYYEPNIFGMVSVFGLLLNFYLRKRSFIWNSVVISGIILTFATTTYFMLISSLVFQLLIGKKNFRSLNNKNLFLATILAFALLLVPFMGFGVPGALKGVPVLSRINDLSVPGTSGYYRVTAPISSVAFVFANYPLGIGIGSIDLFLNEAPSEISRFFVKGHSSYGRTVDNIILGWIFSFGLFSIFFLGLFFNILKKTITHVSVGLAISMFIFCWGTGSFLFIEFWALLLILFFLNLSFDGSGRILLRYENLHA